METFPFWGEQNFTPSNISEERRSRQGSASRVWSPPAMAAGQPGLRQPEPPGARWAARRQHRPRGLLAHGIHSTRRAREHPGKLRPALPVLGRDAGKRAKVMQGWAGNLPSEGWRFYETRNTLASIREFRGDFSFSRSKNSLSLFRLRHLDRQLKPGQSDCKCTSFLRGDNE